MDPIDASSSIILLPITNKSHISPGLGGALASRALIRLKSPTLHHQPRNLLLPLRSNLSPDGLGVRGRQIDDYIGIIPVVLIEYPDHVGSGPEVSGARRPLGIDEFFVRDRDDGYGPAVEFGAVGDGGAAEGLAVFGEVGGGVDYVRSIGMLGPADKGLYTSCGGRSLEDSRKESGGGELGEHGFGFGFGFGW